MKFVVKPFVKPFARIQAAALLLCLSSASPAAADGWHNAALATSSLDEWLADVKAAVPNLEKKMSSNEVKAGRDLSNLKKGAGDKSKGGPPRKGGSVTSDLTAEQQQLLGRKANDCLEALAYMQPNNIFPAEFPNFQLQKIPQYHKAAKQLLGLMGPVGATSVAGELRATLMGMGRRQGFDVALRSDYYDELLSLLRDAGERGDLSDDDLDSLREAAAGSKDGSVADLAKKVQAAIDNIEAGGDLGKLIAKIEELQDAKRKQQLLARARKNLPKAEVGELIEGLRVVSPKSPLHQDILKQIQQRLPQMSVLDLLRMREGVNDKDLARSAEIELGQKRPKFSEVKSDLPAVAKFFQSSDASLAQAAEDQLINAFQRAPIGDCLEWLGRGDKRLADLIWKQLDARIARADAERKAGYRDAALGVVREKSSRAEIRGAAVELLGRLGDQEAAGTLIELLPQLPRETWGKAGATLEKLTGERFGPKPGDGIAELNVALKKWRAWKQNAQKR